MEYAKPLMSISELRAMGYGRDYLMRVVHSKHSSKVAVRTTGKWYIKTGEFEKLQNRGCFS